MFWLSVETSFFILHLFCNAEGFDGRCLRGKTKVRRLNNCSNNAYTLLDDVHSFTGAKYFTV